MPLSALNERSAVLRAIGEYDELGREAFLARYGYGPSRSYFLEHNGKEYDSKAIAGVAVGKQFPSEGPLRQDQFSGGDATVRAKLESLGFRVRSLSDEEGIRIACRDIDLLRASRTRDRYANLSSEEHAAYERVHAALGRLGLLVKNELGRTNYEVRLTSGFHLQSGIRGGVPKDLWFGVYRQENVREFLGNPQLFAIVSGKGVEVGFYASTHPSHFTNAALKVRLRGAAPNIYRQLPDPESDQAAQLERNLQGRWDYRRKSRLEPGRSEFDDLSSWLRYFKSPAGAKEGGGGITRWITGDALDATDLAEVVREMARVFEPLMSSIRALSGESPPNVAESAAVVGRSFSSLFGEMLDKLELARRHPFREVPDLWQIMREIQTRLDSLGSLARRPHIVTKWSLGKGSWANVPWIALLNRNATTSTQSGTYVALLVSENLSAIYATLNQGITELVNELGQKAAVRTLKEQSEAYQAQLSHMTMSGIKLGNEIDLRSDWPASLN